MRGSPAAFMAILAGAAAAPAGPHAKVAEAFRERRDSTARRC
jgi:hypothetical protein